MTEIRKIMGLLLLLVVLFSVGLWVMSSLNLTYSQEELSALRMRQIEETFAANLHRINSHHTLIERNARQLASLGELFLRLHKDDGGGYKGALESALLVRMREFPEVLGGGIWFEPYAYAQDQKYFAVYGYWKKNRPEVTWKHSAGHFDYHNKSWYRAALPADWPREQPREEKYFWTLARYDELLETVVISLSTPMYDSTRRLVGVATIDWSFDDIVELIRDVNITPNSFAFLLDAKERKFTSLSKSKAVAMQTLVSQLSYQTFEKNLMRAGTRAKARHNAMQRLELSVNGQVHAQFFAKSHAGMVFGISVPVAELNAVIVRMRAANYQIAGVALASLLVIAGIILYRVGGIMRLLDSFYHDRLTGLPSRNKLLQELRARDPDALILLNIDVFKELNDFYGHECGDYILKTLAQELKENFIPHIQLGGKLPVTRLYRMPSDEFAVCLRSDRANEETLTEYLKKLSEFVASRPFHYAGQDISLSATQGAALHQHQEIERKHSREDLTDSILAYANMALKLAKQEKQHYFVYDPSLHILQAYEHNLTWAKKLKQYIAENRITPYFQPILNTHTGQIEKYECLIRIIDEQNTVVLPMEFLSVAKRLKLYQKTTELMVEKSFELLRGSNVEFSINLAYQDIISKDTTEFIKRKLHEYQIASKVVFEILESEGIENYDRVHAFIRDVKALGCKIAIDDFGTGYSNFEHLLRLDADIVKIDGSLIKNLDTDPNARVITEGIVKFAKQLKMATVAEFVHSEEILKHVQEFGIDYAQGYHIDPPQPFENLKLKADKS